MKYKIIPEQVPCGRRAEINRKILDDIASGAGTLPNEVIYNFYTGTGGLHGLKQEDFANYHEYARAKQEFEAGQFFTPHEVCRDMVELVSPAPSDTVLDICCGMGNFFNHLSNHFNACGIDIDENAVRVARHLYPDAGISVCDIRQYIPEQGFDIIFGNPPFNLDFEGVKSQVYYFHKAYWALNPGGLLVAIVPCSFLPNENWDKRNIANINRDFSFIGQCGLDPGAFAPLGVSRFETKIMAFARESQHMEMHPYKADEFTGMQDLKARIEQAKGSKQEVKLKIIRETNEELTGEEKAFRYKLDKYLYELKTHKHLKPHHNKALALVSRFRNQKLPVNPTNGQFREWEKSKLTYAKVQAVIRRYIKDQDRTPRKEIALVRTGYGYKLKAYAPRMLDGISRRYVPFYDLIGNGCDLPGYKVAVEKLKKQCPENYRPKVEKLMRQYTAAYKEIKRKRREFNIQHEPFESMQSVPELDRYIGSLTFRNKELETCRFLDLQKRDMSLVFQKRYALLNWQQGSGKTAVLYHFGKYRLGRDRVKNMVVLAPANAVEMIWEPFLKRNGEEYTLIEKPEDILKIRPGGIILVKLSKLNELAKGLKRYMKMSSNKVCLVFDECDEITNPAAARTKACLDVFRRAKYKILGTGTATRNNITELYPQLELLYNNSCNFISYCDSIYYEDKEHNIAESANPHYLEPFPPRGGTNLFKACFCPGKATVFGIGQHNQDIYNKDILHRLISKTIITRKFREFAGEKYTVYSHQVSPAEAEKQVYTTMLEEFHRICGLVLQLYRGFAERLPAGAYPPDTAAYQSLFGTQYAGGLLRGQLSAEGRQDKEAHQPDTRESGCRVHEPRFAGHVRLLPGRSVSRQAGIHYQERRAVQTQAEDTRQVRGYCRRDLGQHPAEPEELGKHTFLQRCDHGSPAMEYPEDGTVLLPLYPAGLQRTYQRPFRNLQGFDRTEPDGPRTGQGAAERIYQDG